MNELSYRPVKYHHDVFLKKAGKRPGFKSAYDALAIEYAVASEMSAAHAQSDLIQEAVALFMGISKR